MPRDDYKIRQPFNATYAWHKGRNRACAHYRLYNSEGKRKLKTKYFTLGVPFESKESIAEYQGWLKEMDVFNAAGIGTHTTEYTIGEMKKAWLEFRQKYYCDAKREGNHDRVIAAILAPYDKVAANDFRASHLVLLRDQIQTEAEEKDNRNRNTINNYIGDCINIFSWGSVRDYVKGSVVAALKEIKNLSRKESPKLRESVVVQAAKAEDVEAAIKAATPTIATMLILQRKTGARPKEIRDMRWEDIDTSGKLWVYIPATHKNRNREIDRGMKNSRAVYLTQAAQDALFEYQTIRPDPKNEYIFTRRESNSFLRLERHWEKFTPEVLAVLEKVTTRTEAAQLDPSARQTHSKNAKLFTYVQAAKELGVHWQTVRKWKKNKPQDMTLLKAFAKEPLKGNGLYSIASYAKTVERACDLSGVKFTPYQIRHLVAEEIDEKFGREAVAAVLGHKNLETSAIYTKRNIALAARTQEAMEEQEA